MALLLKRCGVRVERVRGRDFAEAWAVRTVWSYFPDLGSDPHRLPSGACKARGNPGNAIRRAVKDQEFRYALMMATEADLAREFVDAIEAARDIDGAEAFITQQAGTYEKSDT